MRTNLLLSLKSLTCSDQLQSIIWHVLSKVRNLGFVCRSVSICGGGLCEMLPYENIESSVVDAPAPVPNSIDFRLGIQSTFDSAR